MSRYIPPDLIQNILARLPVKDVLRCTTVCKSWYSLITSSSFTSLHLKLSTPNQTPSLLFTYKTCSTSRQNYTLLVQNQILIEIQGPDHPWTLDTFNIVGSFNGLFLLNMEFGNMTMLYNPSLRKSVTLPTPMNLCRSYQHKLGFCFLSATNDYMIVRLSFPLHDPNEVKGQIYELSTGSWRNIENADTIPYCISSSRQAVLKDVIHWYAHSRYNYGQTLIGSFNMKSEDFGTLMLPNLLQYEPDLIIKLSTFQESLCFVHVQYACSVVWVMKEYSVTDSWAKQFNIDLGFYMRGPICFTENGGILVGPYGDSNNGTDIILYDFINQKVIKNIKASDRKVYGIMADAYMESLVLI